MDPVDVRDTDDNTFPAGPRTASDVEERVGTRASRSDQWIWLDMVHMKPKPSVRPRLVLFFLDK